MTDDQSEIVDLHTMVERAMQLAWDDFVTDTGCFPDCFTLGADRTLYADFGRGNFARMVTMWLEPPLVKETQVRWVWPDIPEGWRMCDNATVTHDGRMFRTATAAPRDESPYDYAHSHIEATRHEDVRWVSPWVEVPDSGRHSAGGET